MNVDRLILELHEIEAIEFGQFKLKSGLISPYYIDLRLLISYPYLLERVADVFWETIRLKQFDLIAGVPYAAIPIATVISYKYNRPMIFVRKERKSYGKQKLVEGNYHANQTVILIDDVISDGASKLETAHSLEDANLKVKCVVTLLDRLQGGRVQITKAGYNCSCITDMRSVLRVLRKENRINPKIEQEVLAFIKRQQTVLNTSSKSKVSL